MNGYRVVFHPEADLERRLLSASERRAVRSAIRKLCAEGPQLPFPHQSKVLGSAKLRELRPSAGRSPLRLLYARISADVFLVAAVAPEAVQNKRGFRRAVKRAERRVSEVI